SAKVASNDSMSADKVSWGTTFIGGKAGKADTAQTPVKIGWINQDGGAVSLPEATDGAKAAESFINEQLGGLQGHPLQLVTCSVTSEEDGQKCGTQFVNDKDVKGIAQGILVVGNQSLYSVVNGQLPDFVASLNATQDFTAKNALSYYPGSPDISQGLAIYAAKDLAAKAAGIIYIDTAAAAAAAQRSKATLQQLGVSKVTTVAVPANATGPAVASALQAAGADKVDALLVRATVPVCISIIDGMQSLGLKTPVLSPATCMATPISDHLNGAFPENWYFATSGYNPFVPDIPSGNATFRAAMKQYKPTASITPFSNQSFGIIMDMAKLINQVGVSQLTPDALTAAAKSFTGPGMAVTGTLKCGFNTTYPNECAEGMGIANFKGGKWTSVRGGEDNNPLYPWQS
ncbi:MAG TPA: ABC transporter substrate-binding protein, partial [Acidimicrobiales bacterium]|nr:ABC transporter substrate-binding protein [Acidimicrobiales bacterium]